MDGTLLRRLGLWLLIIAIPTALLWHYVPEARGALPGSLPGLARGAGVAGAVLLALGWMLSTTIGPKCRRCDRPVAKGSVFCAYHQQEVRSVTREIKTKNLRDNRRI